MGNPAPVAADDDDDIKLWRGIRASFANDGNRLSETSGASASGLRQKFVFARRNPLDCKGGEEYPQRRDTSPQREAIYLEG